MCPSPRPLLLPPAQPHLSNGTRKEVLGRNVRMSLRPCSGLSLYSSGAGSRRNLRLRPPGNSTKQMVHGTQQTQLDHKSGVLYLWRKYQHSQPPYTQHNTHSFTAPQRCVQVHVLLITTAVA